jgi:hypothetical protein
MRWRLRSTISIGPIRFLRSASRNSATLLASTPALFAGFAAVRAVVLAALRACCWRPRAWPPFFAAALRLVDDPELDALVRLRDDADDERLLAERVLLAPELLARVLLAPELLALVLLAPVLLAPELLARLVPERLLLDALERFDPPLDLPVLRRSAIVAPLVSGLV